jgi:hypothetical protein
VADFADAGRSEPCPYDEEERTGKLVAGPELRAGFGFCRWVGGAG